MERTRDIFGRERFIECGHSLLRKKPWKEASDVADAVSVPVALLGESLARDQSAP